MEQIWISPKTGHAEMRLINSEIAFANSMNLMENGRYVIAAFSRNLHSGKTSYDKIALASTLSEKTVDELLSYFKTISKTDLILIKKNGRVESFRKKAAG